MDSVGAVDKELDRVTTKFQTIQDHVSKVIDDVSVSFEEIQKNLDRVPPEDELTFDQIDDIKETIKKAKEKLQRLTTEHRDLHGTVSKVGKSIDRNFVSDFSSTSRSDVLLYQKNIDLLNKVIAQHFYRQGMDDVAKLLIKEGELEADEIITDPYADLHRIWESIRKFELDAAIQWATRYSEELTAKRSAIEFKLHTLAYLKILSSGLNAQQEAIIYARQNFAKFMHNFESDIQKLMGTLLYVPNGLEKSPYKNLIEPNMWIEAADTFLVDACKILGINKDSPLAVVTSAGTTALPALLNLKQVMLSRQVMGIWTGRDELPIEIDLDPENRYHSVFACPILRQQSSDDNPPMKLSCGHVISRDALNKLSNGPILKCPYCPMEQSPTDAKRIYF